MLAQSHLYSICNLCCPLHEPRALEFQDEVRPSMKRAFEKMINMDSENGSYGERVVHGGILDSIKNLV